MFFAILSAASMNNRGLTQFFEWLWDQPVMSKTVEPKTKHGTTFPKFRAGEGSIHFIRFPDPLF